MMNRLRKFTPLLAVALVSGAIAVPGCSKKAPPPPPPPPPPPAAPATVSFDSMMQTLKSDPRVQAAGNLDVTDESFARSALLLADGFARGDAEKLKGMMSNRAKGVIDGMVSDGSWDEIKGRIEAVRIVYAGSPGSVGDIERQAGIAQMKAMWPGQLAAFDDLLTKRGIDKNEKDRLKEFFKQELQKQLDAAQNSKTGLGDEADTSNPAGGGDTLEMVMLMAVQTPMGADLLGWTARKAGDSWVFNNASTLNSARAKASDWDNVGMFGFSLGTGKAPSRRARPPRRTRNRRATRPAPASQGRSRLGARRRTPLPPPTVRHATRGSWSPATTNQPD
ncbi:MAG: hypothetical protein QM783_15145 [Phycisphaerales bacterium]